MHSGEHGSACFTATMHHRKSSVNSLHAARRHTPSISVGLNITYEVLASATGFGCSVAMSDGGGSLLHSDCPSGPQNFFGLASSEAGRLAAARACASAWARAVPNVHVVPTRTLTPRRSYRPWRGRSLPLCAPSPSSRPRPAWREARASQRKAPASRRGD